MRFEVSEKITTLATQESLLAALEAQFKKVSRTVKRSISGNALIVKTIEGTFGSVNRSDTTTISLRKVDGGWLVVADVNYQPSAAFWIILILCIFTYILWLLPIAFYLTHKNTVRSAISGCFRRVKNEFDQPMGIRQQPASTSMSIADLEKLAELKVKGFITESDYEAKKKQILGI